MSDPTTPGDEPNGRGFLVRLLLSRPWLTAPLLGIRRQRAVAASVLVSVAVLTAAAASSPLYASSVGTAAFAHGDAASCPDVVSPYVAMVTPIGRAVDETDLANTPSQAGGESRFASLDAQVRAAGRRLPFVSKQATLTLVSDTLQIGASKAAALSGAQQVALVAKPDATNHVELERGAHAVDGIDIPDTLAQALGVTAGGSAVLAFEGRAVGVPIAGVYRDLTRSPFATGRVAPFWCQLSQLQPKLFSSSLSGPEPPAAIVVSSALFRRLDQSLQPREDRAFWDFGLQRQGLTLARADAVAAAEREPSSAQVPFSGSLPELDARAHAIRDSVKAAIGPISGAAVVIALILVGGSGLFWAQRRSRDAALLSSRGVPPWALGVKAALETLPNVAVGAVAGWGLSLVVVPVVSPSSRLEAGVPATVAVRAGIAALVAVALIGVVATVRVRSQVPRSRRLPGWLAGLPWELAVLAVALVVFARLPSAASGQQDATGLVRPGTGLVVFPLLLLAALVALAARLLASGTRAGHARGWGSRWWTVPWLVSRRLAGSAAAAAALAASTALPLGLLVYSAVVNASASATVAAKVGVFVGSATQVSGGLPEHLPTGLPAGTTEVFRVDDVATSAGLVDVLGVDPATWPSAASWDASYASRGPRELLSALAGPTGNPPHLRLPTVEVGQARALAPGTTLTADTGTVSIAVVGTASVAPGQRSRTGGLVLAQASAVRALFPTAERQIWSRAAPAQLISALRRAGVSPAVLVDQTGVIDASALLPLTWTFDYISGLGLLVSLVAVCGLVLRLEAEHRTRSIDVVFSRRMGLSSGRAWCCLAAELAVPSALGALVGVLVSTLAGDLAGRHFDVQPDLPPGPLFRAAPAQAATAVAVLLLAVGLIALAFHLRYRRSNLGELLRA